MDKFEIILILCLFFGGYTRLASSIVLAYWLVWFNITVYIFDITTLFIAFSMTQLSMTLILVYCLKDRVAHLSLLALAGWNIIYIVCAYFPLISEYNLWVVQNGGWISNEILLWIIFSTVRHNVRLSSLLALAYVYLTFIQLTTGVY